jgi:TPR repeat protein
VNREEAIKWMTKSAEQGDEDAKEWLEEQGLALQQA